MPGARRGEKVEPAGPGLQLIPADHLAVERRRPPRRRLRRQAAHRRDRGPRVPVRLDHQRVRVHPQQGVQREQVTGVLQHPAAVAVRQADQLQVAPVPAVGAGPVLPAQPGRVAGQVGQALERDRPHRLAQQLPAFLHLVRRHVMHGHELGVQHMVPVEAGLDGLEHRIAGPGLPRRAGLGHLGQPCLQALVRRIRGEQPVQRGRAGPGQPDHEHRPLDRHAVVFRVPGPRRLAGQPGRQRAAQQRTGHPDALGGQPGVAGVGLQQHGEAVAVVVIAEVRQPGKGGGCRVQVRRSTDALAAAHCSPGGAAPLGPAGLRPVLARGTTPRNPSLACGQCWPGGDPRNPRWPAAPRLRHEDLARMAQGIAFLGSPLVNGGTPRC